METARLAPTPYTAPKFICPPNSQRTPLDDPACPSEVRVFLGPARVPRGPGSAKCSGGGGGGGDPRRIQDFFPLAWTPLLELTSPGDRQFGVPCGKLAFLAALLVYKVLSWWNSYTNLKGCLVSDESLRPPTREPREPGTA